MALPSYLDSVIVDGDAGLVDTVSSTLGKVVTNKEILDLPLNGRNFTQLGLLQAGSRRCPPAFRSPAAACAAVRVIA